MGNWEPVYCNIIINSNDSPNNKKMVNIDLVELVPRPLLLPTSLQH